MRIGIDARYLSHGLMNGIHTYLTNLIPALLTVASEDEIVLYADRKQPFELENLPPNAAVRYLPWRRAIDSVRNDLTFRGVIARDRLDVMHFPANYGLAPASVASVITLHDALNIFPLWEATRRDLKRPKTVAKTCYLQGLTRYAVRHATMLMTVSEDAKRDIVRHHAFPGERIIPIPHAPGPRFLAVPDAGHLAAVRERYQLPRQFVLADAFKNPAVLVRAWARLPNALRRAHQIVFFSRSPDVRPAVREAVERGDARLLIRPSEEELAALHRLAAAFIFPSWIEGFGLPILEAMASGTPVIASDRFAIPEVAGGAALLIDAEDDAMLAAYLMRVLTDPDEADRLRRAGKERAAMFSWPRSASMVLSVYHAAYAHKRASAGQEAHGERVRAPGRSLN
jgi:glycosyltransferase involved in cell wall biosynthesis